MSPRFKRRVIVPPPVTPVKDAGVRMPRGDHPRPLTGPAAQAAVVAVLLAALFLMARPPRAPRRRPHLPWQPASGIAPCAGPPPLASPTGARRPLSGSEARLLRHGREGRAAGPRFRGSDHGGLAPINAGRRHGGVRHPRGLPGPGKVMTYLAEDVPAGRAKLFALTPDPADGRSRAQPRTSPCKCATHPACRRFSVRRKARRREPPAENGGHVLRGTGGLRRHRPAEDPETARFGGGAHAASSPGSTTPKTAKPGTNHRRPTLRASRRLPETPAPTPGAWAAGFAESPPWLSARLGLTGKTLARDYALSHATRTSAYSHRWRQSARSTIDDDTLLMVARTLPQKDHILIRRSCGPRVSLAMSVFLRRARLPNPSPPPTIASPLSPRRALVCKKLEMLPECVARGYPTAPAWLST